MKTRRPWPIIPTLLLVALCFGTVGRAATAHRRSPATTPALPGETITY